jgi:hypothetical protein
MKPETLKKAPKILLKVEISHTLANICSKNLSIYIKQVFSCQNIFKHFGFTCHKFWGFLNEKIQVRLGLVRVRLPFGRHIKEAIENI